MLAPDGAVVLHTRGAGPTLLFFASPKKSNQKKGDPATAPTTWVPCASRITWAAPQTRPLGSDRCSPNSPRAAAMLGAAGGEASQKQLQLQLQLQPQLQKPKPLKPQPRNPPADKNDLPRPPFRHSCGSRNPVCSPTGCLRWMTATALNCPERHAYVAAGFRRKGAAGDRNDESVECALNCRCRCRCRCF